MDSAIFTPEGYTDRIRQELENCLTETNLPQGEKITGRSFEFPEADQPIKSRLESNLAGIK